MTQVLDATCEAPSAADVLARGAPGFQLTRFIAKDS